MPRTKEFDKKEDLDYFICLVLSNTFHLTLEKYFWDR